MSLTLPHLLRLLESSLGTSVSFPGHWSPILFIQDLETSPGFDIVKNLQEAVSRSMSYLEFYRLTRGRDHPQSKNVEYWELFERGSMMLYFEELFLEMISTETPLDPNLVAYLEILSREPIESWDEIVKNAGAYCFEFFSRRPHRYMRFLSEISPVTDFDAIKRLGVRPSRADDPNVIFEKV